MKSKLTAAENKHVLEYMKKHGCSRKTAIRHMFKGTPSTAAVPAAEPKVERNFNPQTKSYEVIPTDEQNDKALAAVDKPVAKKSAKKTAAPKPEVKGVSAEGLAKRTSGTNRYNVAGRPTREQIELVYGPKSFAMTWPQREATGVSAEQFQGVLKTKLAAATK
jgi:hypothetical protein